MSDIKRIPWNQVHVDSLQYVTVDWLQESLPFTNPTLPAGVGIIVWDKEVGTANNKPLYCALFPESLQKALLEALEFWNAGTMSEWRTTIINEEDNQIPRELSVVKRVRSESGNAAADTIKDFIAKNPDVGI